MTATPHHTHHVPLLPSTLRQDTGTKRCPHAEQTLQPPGRGRPGVLPTQLATFHPNRAHRAERQQHLGRPHPPLSPPCLATHARYPNAFPQPGIEPAVHSHRTAIHQRRQRRHHQRHTQPLATAEAPTRHKTSASHPGRGAGRPRRIVTTPRTPCHSFRSVYGSGHSHSSENRTHGAL